MVVYDKLAASIEKELAILYRLGFWRLSESGIGVATATQVTKTYENKWRKIAALTYDELITIDGIGEVLARDYEAFFADEHNKQVLSDLIGMLDIDEIRSCPMNDRIDIRNNRQSGHASHRAQEEIEAQGGKVQQQCQQEHEAIW